MVCIAELFAFCDLHVSRWGMPQFVLPPMYYDRAGFPIPSDTDDDYRATLAWARMREWTVENESYVVVASDILPDGSRLSTVWLGIDHGFGGRPLIFETMRFHPDTEYAGREFPDPFGEPGDTTEQLRYTTEEEALAAHHAIVRRIRITQGH